MKALKLLRTYYKQDPTQLVITGLILVLVLGLAISGLGEKSVATAPRADAIETSDQWIPEGWILLPIRLENQESLISLIGDYAWADLYTTSPDGRSKGIKVAKKIKLIRSSSDPTQLAVMATEEQAGQIATLHAGFVAVIRRRETSIKSTDTQKQTLSRIQKGADL